MLFIFKAMQEISELDGAIALLNSEVGDLSKKITELEGKISDMTESLSYLAYDL